MYLLANVSKKVSVIISHITSVSIGIVNLSSLLTIDREQSTVNSQHHSGVTGNDIIKLWFFVTNPSTHQLYDCFIILYQRQEFVKFAKFVLVPLERVKVDRPEVDDLCLSTHQHLKARALNPTS